MSVTGAVVYGVSFGCLVVTVGESSVLSSLFICFTTRFVYTDLSPKFFILLVFVLVRGTSSSTQFTFGTGT